MEKQVKFNQEARQDLIDGMNIVANAVKATLGAKGRNVVIRRQSGDIHITKDGVTVAEEVFLKDKSKDIGAQIIKQAAKRAAAEAGDGTTTATVLAQHLINASSKNIVAGAAPTDIKKGMEEALKEIVAKLKNMATPVKDNIKSIATISANNDEELGKVIAGAFDEVGVDGVVTMEKSKNENTYYEIDDGVEYSGGLISPYFINNNKKMCAEYEDAVLLVYEGDLSDIKDLIHIFEYVIKNNKPIVIICEDMYGSALDSILQNTNKGSLKAIVARAPSYGEDRKLSMEDISIITGATFISKESGIQPNEIQPNMLGDVGKVIVNQNSITLIDVKGSDDAISSRLRDISDSMKAIDDKAKKDQYNQRYAKIISGVATVYVGASTEVEAREKIDRVDDAIQATRAAIEEGVVVGGGVALIRVAQSIKIPQNIPQDVATGWKIALSACEQPLRCIVENTGVDASVVIGNVKQSKGNSGFNAKTETYSKDLMKDGVIDPVKVTRTAFDSAVSVAGMIIMTEVSIVDEGR